jgi:transcriptional regulator with XRE-family HTH domain
MKTNEIKKWLIDKGLTQQDIKRRAKVSQPLVSQVIKGERRSGPKAKKVVRALKKLGCPEEFLEK